jgi:hypothetical protein
MSVARRRVGSKDEEGALKQYGATGTEVKPLKGSVTSREHGGRELELHLLQEHVSNRLRTIFLESASSLD